MSCRRTQIVWNLRVCIQQEETEDSIKYNVTWHSNLLCTIILRFFPQASFHRLYRLQVGPIGILVGLVNCELDCVVMPDRWLPKSTAEHKIACVRHSWVEHTLREREENLCHVCVVHPIISEGTGKQSTLVRITRRLVGAIIYKNGVWNCRSNPPFIKGYRRPRALLGHERRA